MVPETRQPRIGIRVYPTAEGLNAPEFLDTANNLLRLVSEVDVMVSGQFVRTVDWNVSQLSYSSPAVLELEPLVREGKTDNRQTIVETVVEGMESLKNSDIRPRYFTDQAVTSARALATHLADKIDQVEVFTDGRQVDVTDAVARNAKAILRPGREVLGSVDGYLEAMNSHEGFEFALYEPVLGARIPCRIADDAEPTLRESVVANYENKVRVSGLLRTNAKGEVRAAKVRELQALRTEAKFRVVEEIAGLFDITGGIEAEEYVRGLRDA